MSGRYARVVVDVAPAHLDRPFDYRVGDGDEVAVGSRVGVSFSGRRRTGWVVGLSDTPQTDVERVRPLDTVDGALPWFDEADLDLLRWVAARYAATLADVLRHALPPRVAAVEAEADRWGPPPPRQRQERPPCAADAWRPYAASPLLKAVFAPGHDAGPAYWLRTLADDDPAALVADLVGRCLAAGRDALVVAADPASPLPDAALAVAGPAAGADYRSDRQRDRCAAFWRCRTGHARVAAGERGAVFAPLQRLGLVVVDDEANPAHKERRSPRHHARDVALARARRAGAVAVLLGDLPSADLWRLLAAGHVATIAADRFTERRRAPRVDVADLSDPRPGTRRTRLADGAGRAIADAVKAGGAAVVLASRRGEGAALACGACRQRLTCPVCSGSLAAADQQWRCAACAWAGPPFPCPACGSDQHAPLAAGAGRLAGELTRAYPDAEVVRMEGFDAPGPQRRPAVAVMTRGSVVARPAWLGRDQADVTVLLDADAMLGRPVLAATEDALRLWFAAARWSRRVVVQTMQPGAHAVQALVRWDPEGFWERESAWRAELRYPPAASLVAVRARGDAAAGVADRLRSSLPAADEVLGPDADGSVLVKTTARSATLAALSALRHEWSKAGLTVRVDVDPVL